MNSSLLPQIARRVCRCGALYPAVASRRALASAAPLPPSADQKAEAAVKKPAQIPTTPLASSTLPQAKSRARRQPTQPFPRAPVCEIMLRSYVPQQLHFFTQFADEAARALGVPTSGVIRLPAHVQRWTMLTSPFKYKKFQEAFERKTHKRLLRVQNYSEVSRDAIEKWIHYLGKTCPAGVSIKVSQWEMEPLDYAAQAQKRADDMIKQQVIPADILEAQERRDMHRIGPDSVMAHLRSKLKTLKAPAVRTLQPFRFILRPWQPPIASIYDEPPAAAAAAAATAVDPVQEPRHDGSYDAVTQLPPTLPLPATPRWDSDTQTQLLATQQQQQLPPVPVIRQNDTSAFDDPTQILTTSSTTATPVVTPLTADTVRLRSTAPPPVEREFELSPRLAASTATPSTQVLPSLPTQVLTPTQYIPPPVPPNDRFVSPSRLYRKPAAVEPVLQPPQMNGYQPSLDPSQDDSLLGHLPAAAKSDATPHAVVSDEEDDRASFEFEVSPPDNLAVDVPPAAVEPVDACNDEPLSIRSSASESAMLKALPLEGQSMLCDDVPTVTDIPPLEMDTQLSPLRLSPIRLLDVVSPIPVSDVATISTPVDDAAAGNQLAGSNLNTQPSSAPSGKPRLVYHCALEESPTTQQPPKQDSPQVTPFRSPLAHANMQKQQIASKRFSSIGNATTDAPDSLAEDYKEISLSYYETWTQMMPNTAAADADTLGSSQDTIGYSVPESQDLPSITELLQPSPANKPSPVRFSRLSSLNWEKQAAKDPDSELSDVSSLSPPSSAASETEPESSGSSTEEEHDESPAKKCKLSPTAHIARPTVIAAAPTPVLPKPQKGASQCNGRKRTLSKTPSTDVDALSTQPLLPQNHARNGQASQTTVLGDRTLNGNSQSTQRKNKPIKPSRSNSTQSIKQRNGTTGSQFWDKLDRRSQMVHAASQKCITVTVSGIGDEGQQLKTEAAQLVASLRKSVPSRNVLSFTDDLQDNLTHVIVVEDENKCTVRTKKYIAGCVRGLWIVSIEWLRACVAAKQLVPEEAYEVLGDRSGGPCRGPSRNRERRTECAKTLRYFPPKARLYFVSENKLVSFLRGQLRDLRINVLERLPPLYLKRHSKAQPVAPTYFSIAHDRKLTFAFDLAHPIVVADPEQYAPTQTDPDCQFLLRRNQVLPLPCLLRLLCSGHSIDGDFEETDVQIIEGMRTFLSA
ncbi:28S ribosomal protein S10, mitochondrial [Sorochytrium milnesiophthora]